VLILGWFLGWLTFSGGRKWRRAFDQERSARIAAEAEVERLQSRASELERERDEHISRAEAANSRIAELDSRRPSVNPDTAGAIAAAASGRRDDLSRIFGVGRGGEVKLNELGVHRYADIVSMSLKEEGEIEARMGLAQGTIADERWRDQAEMLRKGKFDEHARMFA